MGQSISGPFRRPAEFLRRQFLRGGGRPLADVLSADRVGRAPAAIGTAWYDRIYTSRVTMWLFLGQALGPTRRVGPPSPGSTPTGPTGSSPD